MTRGLFGIIKLAGFVVIFPLVAAVVIGFQKELGALKGAGDFFWWGVIAYTIVHLFVFTPQDLYRFWQGVFMEICAFAGVMANTITMAVPIITTILLLVYFLYTMIFHQSWGQESLVFFTGFTLALHVILTAQELYEADESKLKGHYLFALALVFMVNVFLVTGLLDMIFEKFSVVSFWNTGLEAAKHFYAKILDTARIRW